MSSAPASVPAARQRSRLRSWLWRRSDANAGGPANRDLRLIETAVLVVAGLVLAVATANDIGRAVHIAERVSLDKHTYRYYMHTRGGLTTPIRKVAVAPAQRGVADTACAPPIGGIHGSTCLVIAGPRSGAGAQHLRTVVGGYRVVPNARNRFAARYDCFGQPAQQQLCGGRPPR